MGWIIITKIDKLLQTIGTIFPKSDTTEHKALDKIDNDNLINYTPMVKLVLCLSLGGLIDS